MRIGQTIILIAFLLLPVIAGYGLAIYSDRWVSGKVSDNSTLQEGFPLPWKTGYTVPCYDCFGLRVAYNQLNFAVDWVFYSALAYLLLGTVLLVRKRRVGRARSAKLAPTVNPTPRVFLRKD